MSWNKFLNNRNEGEKEDSKKSGMLTHVTRFFLLLIVFIVSDSGSFNILFLVIPFVLMIGIPIYFFRKNAKIIREATQGRNEDSSCGHYESENQYTRNATTTTSSTSYSSSKGYDSSKSILSDRSYGRKISISQSDYNRRLIELKDLYRSGIIEKSEFDERVISLGEEL